MAQYITNIKLSTAFLKEFPTPDVLILDGLTKRAFSQPHVPRGHGGKNSVAVYNGDHYYGTVSYLFYPKKGRVKIVVFDFTENNSMILAVKFSLKSYKQKEEEIIE